MFKMYSNLLPVEIKDDHLAVFGGPSRIIARPETSKIQ